MEAEADVKVAVPGPGSKSHSPQNIPVMCMLPAASTATEVVPPPHWQLLFCIGIMVTVPSAVDQAPAVDQDTSSAEAASAIPAATRSPRRVPTGSGLRPAITVGRVGEGSPWLPNHPVGHRPVPDLPAVGGAPPWRRSVRFEDGDRVVLSGRVAFGD